MNTNLQELNINSPAPFSDDILINYGTFINDNGIVLKAESADFRGDIPIDKIIGIDQMYGGVPWGSFLEGACLDRLQSNLYELNQNPEYYLSDEPKSEMSFLKVGDQYFISQAKHRTIIARFLAHFNQEAFNNRSPLQNVKITEHFIDEEFYLLRKRVESCTEHYPQLTLKIKHYTDENELGFLKVSSGLHNYEFYSRAEARLVLGILEDPSLRGKLNASKVGRSIYQFISMQSILKRNVGEFKKLFS